MYINKNNRDVLDGLSGYQFVSKIKDADVAVVFLTNLGSIIDMFDAIRYKKPVFMVKGNNDISRAFANVIDGFGENIITIEDDYSNVVERMEEKENGESNNGKTYKLL